MSKISISGIALGVFCLMMILTIMAGYNENHKNRIFDSEPHLVVMNSKVEMNDFIKSLPADLYTEITDVFKFEQQDLVVKTIENKVFGLVAKGVEPSSLVKVVDEHFVGLRSIDMGISDDLSDEDKNFFNAEEVQGGIFLSDDLAQRYGLQEGDPIELIMPEDLLRDVTSVVQVRSTKILGLLNLSQNSGSGVKLEGAYYASVSDKSSDSPLEWFDTRPRSLESGFELKLRNPENFMPLYSHLVNSGYEVKSWRDRNSSLFLALMLERLTMSLLLGLAMLITCFSIVSLITLLMTKKKKEIGILLALGHYENKVSKMFGFFGFFISLWGVVLGVTMGTLGYLYLKFIPIELNNELYEDTHLPVKMDIWFFITIVMFIMLLLGLSYSFPFLRKKKSIREYFS